MTAVDLDALAEMLAKATPGPWVVGISCVYQQDGYAPGDPDAPDTRLASCSEADAALITALRNAAPELIRLARLGSHSCDRPVDAEGIHCATCSGLSVARTKEIARLREVERVVRELGMAVAHCRDLENEDDYARETRAAQAVYDLAAHLAAEGGGE